MPEPTPERKVPGRYLPVLLSVALICLVLGLTLPIMEIHNLYIFRGTYSIVDGIGLLLKEGDIFIALVLIAFSIVLPTVKIFALLGLWQRLRLGKTIPDGVTGFIDTIGKWSMLDVFVLALVVVAGKISMFADASMAPAVVPFIFSIALTIHSSRALRAVVAAPKADKVLPG